MKKDQQFKGKIAEEILINERFRYLHIELVEPYRIEFNAGQYISLDIEKEMANYPIASPPAVNHAVELCVVIKSGGKGADYFKALKPGDEVLFSGPFGNFVVEPEKKTLEKKLLLVATASGIAGIRSIILDLLEEKQDQRPIQLVWGLNQVGDMFWVEDFRRLSQYFTNFSFDLTLAKPPEHWPLLSGYVTKWLETEIELDSDWGVYVSGAKEMIKDVKELVGKKSVVPGRLHLYPIV